MDKIYIIEYDNGQDYEDQNNWVGDKCFETEEDAANFLISKGYYKDGSCFLSFRGYKNTAWYEANTYATIKPCYLQKSVKSKTKDFHIEDYTDLPIKSVHEIYNEHVVVIEGTEDVKMKEIKLLSNSNENKLKELNKIFKCIKNIKNRKSIPDYVGLEFEIKLDSELDRFELYATIYLQSGDSYTSSQQVFANSKFRIEGGMTNKNEEIVLYRNLEYRRSHINNDVFNEAINHIVQKKEDNFDYVVKIEKTLKNIHDDMVEIYGEKGDWDINTIYNFWLSYSASIKREWWYTKGKLDSLQHIIGNLWTKIDH